MATWKKLVTTSDTIPVSQGGTGLTTITDGAVLVGNGTGTVASVDLGANEILIGASGTANPVNLSANSDSDVKITNAGDTTYQATIQPTSVLGSMVADDTLDWSTHEKTTSAHALKMPFYAATTGAASLTPAASSSGQVLQYNGSTIVWGTNTASNLAIDDESAVNKVFNIGLGETNGDGTAGLTSGNTDFNVSSNFNLNPQSATDQSLLRLRNSGTVPTSTAAGDSAAGLIIQADATAATNILQISNVYGTATAAKRIVKGTAANSNAYKIGLINNSTTTTLNGSGEQVMEDAGFTYTLDGAGKGTLSVENLNVTGTTTTIDTTQLAVEDHSVRISVPDTAGGESLTDTTAVQQGELGIIVGFNTSADGNMPRVVYKGRADARSVVGWRIANSGTDVDASGASDSFGVGVMVKTPGAMSSSGGTNQNLAGDGALDVGVGAFAIDSSGDLWLQTA